MFYLPVTLTSAGAAALINLWLALRVIRLRFSDQVLVGDGGSPRLMARMRAQLNFAEYTPIMLILIGLIELAKGTSLFLWIVSALFLVGRVLHPFGMDGLLRARRAGILLTFGTTIVLAGYAVWLGYTGMNPLR